MEHTKSDIETAIVKEPCGCLIMTVAKRTKGNKTNLSGFRIEHCQLHKAAPKLLAACEKLYDIEEYRRKLCRASDLSSPELPLSEIQQIAKQAIAEAK